MKKKVEKSAKKGSKKTEKNDKKKALALQRLRQMRYRARCNSSVKDAVDAAEVRLKSGSLVNLDLVRQFMMIKLLPAVSPSLSDFFVSYWLFFSTSVTLLSASRLKKT